MTADKFRELALALPEAEEQEHMDHPDFRVGGKIFATLWPDERKGVVMLNPDQQAKLARASPKIFSPVRGGWGKHGATEVHLPAAWIRATREALTMAWRKRAPKRLLDSM